MIALNDLLVRVPDIPAIPIDEELVLMSSETGNYYSLSSTARAIWEALEEPATLAQVCDTLKQAYEVDDQTCHTQVAEFVQCLRDQSLVLVSRAQA